jgi:hypothetical protein
MTHVYYDVETQVMAEIERLEREAQLIRQRAERTLRDSEKRVLNRQADEIREHIGCLLPNLS